jgi:hypothetical protein
VREDAGEVGRSGKARWRVAVTELKRGAAVAFAPVEGNVESAKRFRSRRADHSIDARPSDPRARTGERNRARSMRSMRLAPAWRSSHRCNAPPRHAHLSL